MSSQPTFDPIAKFWSGPSREIIFNDSLNLGFLMLNVIKTTPHRVVQVCDDSGAEMTCSEMYARALKLANFLSSKIGLKHGDVVGVVANNSENVSPIVLACLTLELPINPLAPSLSESDIIYMFEKTKPKVIFCDEEVAEKVQVAVDKIKLEDCKIFTLMKAVDCYQFVDEIIQLEDDKVVDDFEFPSLDISSTPAFIMCSSGTTSMVKGISKSHKELIHQLYPFFPTSHDQPDVCFTHTGPFWITGIILLGWSTLYGFKRVITSEQFNPELFMDIIDRNKVTMTICPPYLGMKLIRSEKSRPMLSIKTVIIAGAIFNENFVQGIQKLFPNAKMVRLYGMTECIPLAIDWNDKNLSSTGRAASNLKLKVVNEANNALDAQQLGEICYKPYVPFLGYFGEPEKYFETVQADGWILTGDLGYFDEEGYFYVVDRIKNLIKVRGIHFTSTELENIIKTIDGVSDCCVVALVGAYNGYDLVFAFIIKSSDAESLTEKKIEEIVNSQVIEQKKISGGVHFVEKFHHTATGKIKFDEMKKMAKEIYEKGK